MSGGSSQPTTQTTQYNLSPEQRELLKIAMPGLREFSGKPASESIPSFSGVAGFDPLQMQGQEAVVGAAPGQAGVVGTAAGGNAFLSGGNVLYPESNPALRGSIDAATRPIVDTLLEKALPAVRNQAVAAGQFGSSRQGIAEGQAIRGAETAVGDTAAKIASAGYGQGLDAMVKGIGLAPQTAQSLALPGLSLSGVGDVRQALSQAMLGEQTNRFTTEAMWPLLVGKEFAGIAGAIPGGGSTTTASGPQSNSLMQALGLGVAGLGAAGSAMSGAGALLPFLMMSDRRSKQIFAKLARKFRDLPLYAYRYLGEPFFRVGVMADETPAYARVRVNGVDFVDYGAL